VKWATTPDRDHLRRKGPEEKKLLFAVHAREEARKVKKRPYVDILAFDHRGRMEKGGLGNEKIPLQSWTQGKKPDHPDGIKEDKPILHL